jgi:gliding motility-associated-like protein
LHPLSQSPAKVRNSVKFQEIVINNHLIKIVRQPFSKTLVLNQRFEIWLIKNSCVPLYKYRDSLKNETPQYQQLKKPFPMIRTRTKFLFSAIVFFFGLISAQAQLVVSSAMTPQQWVQDVLIGAGIQSSNVTYTGGATAGGTFGGTSNIGLNSGVILTSGNISWAPGPNAGCGSGTGLNLPGDPDLSLACGKVTHDACILEFDFIPESDTVKFRYVFSSEEYNEYVSNPVTFNDVFGFFISGPGITGPYSNNSMNIALVPNTMTPVAIASINNGYSQCGNPSGGPCTNCIYYVDNTGGVTVAYDGFTAVLTAWAVVVPCNTYHIKLAISDASDGILDSGVFLEEGSFSSTSVGISTTYISSSNPNLTAPMAIEGCRKAVMKFTLPYARTDSTWIKLTTITGNAISGVDYTLSGPGFNYATTEVLIKPYHLSGYIEIDPIYDGVAEGTEFVVIGIRKTICDTIDTLISIPIVDYSKIEVNVTNDTAICEGQKQLNVSGGGGMPPYTIQWSPIATLDNPTSPAPLASPTQTTTYYVQVKDSTRCSVAIDSVKVIYNKKPIVSYKPEPYAGCDSLTVVFRNNTTPKSKCTFLWDFGDGTTDTAQNPTHVFHYNAADPKYTINLLATTDAGCYDSYLISDLVTVHPLPEAEFYIAPSDSLVLEKATVTFMNESSATAMYYEWNFGDGMNTTSTDKEPTFTYLEPGYFKVFLKVITQFGCEDTISHMMKVIKESNFKPLIPNIITPNGDGKNDYFIIQNVADSTQDPQPLTSIMLPQNQLLVYNRWGKKVYDQSPYINEWDGSNLPDGVYYFVFRYKKMDIAHQVDGTVTIMR